MSINFFGMSALGGKNYGEVWQPKTQRLMVGRDIAPMTSSEMEGKVDRAVTIGKGDDVAFMSQRIFNFAKNKTQNGFSIRGFRSFENAEALASTDKGQSSLGSNVLHENDQYKLILERNGGSFSLTSYEKVTNEDGSEGFKQLEQVKFSGDAKISFAADGAPQILTGGAALRNGELTATGKDEILIRNSGAAVKAGENTTVYNFSPQSGEFSGGKNVTFLGSYNKSVFKDSEGETTYAGYFEESKIHGGDKSLGVFSGVFENSEINAGANDDSFSGYFSNSVINGGNGENTFKGLFLNHSTVNGGDDDDTFNGRFIASNLNGGKGDDTFGSRIDLNRLDYIAGKNDAYTGLGPDFIKSTIDAGEGDDTFEGIAWDSQINMGDGDDKATGIFTNSSLDGGEGNDTLSAMYSLASAFRGGGGDDAITLATAVASLVNGGEGEDKITLGRNQGDISPNAGVGGDHLMSQTRWLTPEQARHDERGLAFGELRANLVDASQEENRVSINNGQGTNQVATGDILAEEEPESVEEAMAEEKAVAGEKAVEAKNTALAAQANQSADDLALIKQTIPGQNEEEKADKPKVLGRYVAQGGDEALQEGGLAAVVKTGVGENLNFRAMDRGPAFERISDETPVSNLLRKAYDAYSWTAKLG